MATESLNKLNNDEKDSRTNKTLDVVVPKGQFARNVSVAFWIASAIGMLIGEGLYLFAPSLFYGGITAFAFASFPAAGLFLLFVISFIIWKVKEGRQISGRERVFYVLSAGLIITGSVLIFMILPGLGLPAQVIASAFAAAFLLGSFFIFIANKIINREPISGKGVALLLAGVVFLAFPPVLLFLLPADLGISFVFIIVATSYLFFAVAIFWAHNEIKNDSPTVMVNKIEAQSDPDLQERKNPLQLEKERLKQMLDFNADPANVGLDDINKIIMPPPFFSPSLLAVEEKSAQPDGELERAVQKLQGLYETLTISQQNLNAETQQGNPPNDAAVAAYVQARTIYLNEYEAYWEKLLPAEAKAFGIVQVANPISESRPLELTSFVDGGESKDANQEQKLADFGAKIQLGLAQTFTRRKEVVAGEIQSLDVEIKNILKQYEALSLRCQAVQNVLSHIEEARSPNAWFATDPEAQIEIKAAGVESVSIAQLQADIGRQLTEATPLQARLTILYKEKASLITKLTQIKTSLPPESWNKLGRNPLEDKLAPDIALSHAQRSLQTALQALQTKKEVYAAARERKYSALSSLCKLLSADLESCKDYSLSHWLLDINLDEGINLFHLCSEIKRVFPVDSQGRAQFAPILQALEGAFGNPLPDEEIDLSKLRDESQSVPGYEIELKNSFNQLKVAQDTWLKNHVERLSSDKRLQEAFINALGAALFVDKEDLPNFIKKLQDQIVDSRFFTKIYQNRGKPAADVICKIMEEIDVNLMPSLVSRSSKKTIQKTSIKKHLDDTIQQFLDSWKTDVRSSPEQKSEPDKQEDYESQADDREQQTEAAATHLYTVLFEKKSKKTEEFSAQFLSSFGLTNEDIPSYSIMMSALVAIVRAEFNSNGFPDLSKPTVEVEGRIYEQIDLMLKDFKKQNSTIKGDASKEVVESIMRAAKTEIGRALRGGESNTQDLGETKESEAAPPEEPHLEQLVNDIYRLLFVEERTGLTGMLSRFSRGQSQSLSAKFLAQFVYKPGEISEEDAKKWISFVVKQANFSGNPTENPVQVSNMYKALCESVALNLGQQAGSILALDAKTTPLIEQEIGKAVLKYLKPHKTYSNSASVFQEEMPEQIQWLHSADEALKQDIALNVVLPALLEPKKAKELEKGAKEDLQKVVSEVISDPEYKTVFECAQQIRAALVWNDKDTEDLIVTVAAERLLQVLKHPKTTKDLLTLDQLKQLILPAIRKQTAHPYTGLLCKDVEDTAATIIKNLSNNYDFIIDLSAQIGELNGGRATVKVFEEGVLDQEIKAALDPNKMIFNLKSSLFKPPIESAVQKKLQSSIKFQVKLASINDPNDSIVGEIIANINTLYNDCKPTVVAIPAVEENPSQSKGKSIASSLSHLGTFPVTPPRSTHAGASSNPVKEM